MKQVNVKKLLILNLPYLLFVWLFDKAAQTVRLSPGADLSGKLLNLGSGFSQAMESIAPSFHPADLLVGLIGAVVIRLIIYTKGKNAKKYRKGMEYGSARWGTAEDIKPYIDPVFENNVLLTQTERLMMSNRPKNPKYARNKNILVIGGSGSGKTRFFVKPNTSFASFMPISWACFGVTSPGENPCIRWRPRLVPLSMAWRRVQENSMSAVSAEHPKEDTRRVSSVFPGLQI